MNKSGKRKYEPEDESDVDSEGVSCESDSDITLSDADTEEHDSDVDFIDDEECSSCPSIATSDEIDLSKGPVEPLPPRKAKQDAAAFIDRYVEVAKELL